jgi:hypothetical protein
MALGHGGGGHGGGGRGYGWGGGGFTYLVDNSDYALQPVDVQPDGNTISVTCPSSNPFEDHCDVTVETQRSGGIAGPDPRQRSRRIVTRTKRLAPVHAGAALVRQRMAPAVRMGFLPGLGAAPTTPTGAPPAKGKPKPKPAGQKVLIVTPAAETSWWEAMLGGPVGALQVAAMPKAPTVRTVIVPAAKPAAKAKAKTKPKAPGKAPAPVPAGSSPISGWGMGDDNSTTDLFESDDGSDGSDASSGSSTSIPSYATPAPTQAAAPYGPPSLTTVISAPAPTAVPFATSQYVPPPLATQPNLGPGSMAPTVKVAQPAAAPAPASSGPSLFSQLTSTISSIATTGAPALAAVYKTKAAQAAAKTAQAQAQQQSLLQQAAAAAKKPSNLPILLIGGGAVLLTVIMLMRGNRASPV